MSGKFYLEKWIDTDLKPYFDKNRRWSVCDLRAIYVRAFCKGQEQSANRDEEIARRAFEAARESYWGIIRKDEFGEISGIISTYATETDYINSEDFKKATK